MPCQLPFDCLHEIFEYLEGDIHSCLLVNHLWCEVSVRILWRNIDYYRTKVKILDTLIACFPDESKDLLQKNGIFISTPTSNPPLFNYVSFCKSLSVDEIEIMVNLKFSEDKNLVNLVIQEIFKMFMKQTSLKKLSYNPYRFSINFTYFPETRNCLTGLSKFICRSNLHSEFCYQLSQICHNIRSISIEFMHDTSNGLKDLISSQNSLKCLSLRRYKFQNWADIVLSLMRSSNSLIKLKIDGGFDFDFKGLQYVTFPQFQILKFKCGNPDAKSLIKFLEINGKNLKEFYAEEGCDNSINLAIARFCPNLISLYTHVHRLETSETLKLIFHGCEQLEKIKVYTCNNYSTVQRVLKIVAKYSPKNFQELELDNYARLLPEDLEDLESFFISWKNRIPQKPISLIISGNVNNLDKNMKIVENYKKLGTIKKFEIITLDRAFQIL